MAGAARPTFRHNAAAAHPSIGCVMRKPLSRSTVVVLALAAGAALLGLATTPQGPARAQACPPYCQTPVITPAWHLHMCDESYQEQLDDNHCMRGPGVTEFPQGTTRVYAIYCHKHSDTVMVFIKDAGGGLQFVNHPDGVTYEGEGCETLVFSHTNGIPPGGSPYFTSASWPEGPFSGVGAGIEWYIGLFVGFDQDNYYGNKAEAVITARDPGASQDPFQREAIEVRVTSSSDPTGIPVVLREQTTGFSLFKTEQPLRFSQTASSAAQGVIKVANRDVVTVSYCPRSCATPYADTATWYQLEVTVTPTPLPTWAGPAPTATATPPPDLDISFMTLRPAPADVGYVPQVGANKERANHLGYPTIYAGMWTHGRNVHHGMVQFDLSSLPEGARIVDARLEMVGRESRYTKPGEWRVQLLDAAIDAPWREATYDQVHGAAVLAPLEPVLYDYDLAVGRRNGFGLSGEATGFLNDRLRTTRRVSFRMDGPGGEDNNLFAWESGVDTYNRASDPPDPALGPSLHLSYIVPPEATPTPQGTHTPTRTSLPEPATLTSTPAGGTTPPPSPSVTPTSAGGTPAGGTTDPPAPTTPTSGTATASRTWTATAGAPPPASATASGPPTQRQVCVLAYDDRSGDGQRDPDERFLAGVTLRLTHVRTGVFDSWTTDGANDPDYCWNGLIDGPYTLKAVTMPRGFVASGASEVRFDVPFAGPPARYLFGARRPDVATATRAPSATAAPTDTPAPTPSPIPSPTPTVIGPSGEVCLGVFEDRDRDRARGAGEGWLAGFRLRVLDQSRAPLRELTSRADGPVCVLLGVGVYFTAAAPRPGLVPTTPMEEPVLLTEGVRRGVAFGWFVPGPREQAYLPRTVRDPPRGR